MRFRTFFSILFLFGVAMGVVFLLLPNRVLLEQPMDVWGRSMPIWAVVLGTFTLGIAIGGFFQLTGAGRGAIHRLVSIWSERHRHAAERALNRGLQAERAERFDQALAAFREAAQLQPRNYQIQMQFGDALRRARRYSEAIEAHEAARRLDAESGEPGYALALDYIEAGHLDAARRELQLLIENDPKSAVPALRRWRDLEISALNWRVAESAARKLEALTASPDDRRQFLGVRTELARARAKAGQTRSALGILKKLMKEHPDFLPAVLLSAELRFDAGEIAEAREALLEGFRRSQEPALLDRLASFDLQRERPEEAISTLRGLVAAGGKTRNAATLALGNLYLRLEMLDEAAQRFEELHEAEPRSPLVDALLARTEERRGRHQRAAQLFRSVIDNSDRMLQQAGCEACKQDSPRWAPRCIRCGQFGTVRTRLSSDSKVPQGSVLYPSH